MLRKAAEQLGILEADLECKEGLITWLEWIDGVQAAQFKGLAKLAGILKAGYNSFRDVSPLHGLLGGT